MNFGRVNSYTRTKGGSKGRTRNRIWIKIGRKGKEKIKTNDIYSVRPKFRTSKDPCRVPAPGPLPDLQEKKSNIKCVEEWTREILSSDQTLFAGYCATRFKLLDTDAQLSSTVLLYTYDIEMISFKTSPLSPFILRTTRTISQCDKVFFYFIFHFPIYILHSAERKRRNRRGSSSLRRMFN